MNNILIYKYGRFNSHFDAVSCNLAVVKVVDGRIKGNKFDGNTLK
jgi:hypothetical protein